MFTLIDFRHIHKIGRTMTLVCSWIEVVLQPNQGEWFVMTRHVGCTKAYLHVNNHFQKQLNSQQQNGGSGMRCSSRAWLRQE